MTSALLGSENNTEAQIHLTMAIGVPSPMRERGTIIL